MSRWSFQFRENELLGLLKDSLTLHDYTMRPIHEAALQEIVDHLNMYEALDSSFRLMNKARLEQPSEVTRSGDK